MAFATPAELAAYTKGRILATDPRAQLVLDGATRAIQRYAGWHIYPSREETFTLDTDGTDLLQLPTLRLTALGAVTSTDEDLTEVTFQWSALGLVRRTCGCFPYGFRTVTVTATHGFDQVEDLKQVVLQVAAMALSSPTGATREQAGQVAMGWATTAPGVAGGLSLLDRDLAVVNSYKLPGRL